jgi:uncharacterized membrane protein YphA (DoxX/SURF4 family)
METLLWILQALLGAVFLITGLTKLTQPRVRMAAGPMEWAADVTDNQFRAIGAVEVLGAIGLILPAALDIAPMLTPIAAVGLAATMIVAVVTHLGRGEMSRILAPLILLVMALVVAVARFGPYSL